MDYLLFVITIVGVYGIIALGSGLLMGYAGQISLGQAAFFGVGAYTSVLLVLKLNFPFVVAVVLAMLTAGAFGLLLGMPSLRISGVYLAMVTLAANIVIEKILIVWDSLTMGIGGILNIPPASVWGWSLDSRTYPYLVYGILLLEYLALRALIRSRHGLAFQAIRENELAASCFGISPFFYKLMAFMISAVLGGLAGSLYAFFVRYINPEIASMWLSFSIAAGVLLGGSHSLLGPIIGIALITFLPEYLYIFETYRLLFYGGLLVVSALFLRKGVVGLIEQYVPQLHAKADNIPSSRSANLQGYLPQNCIRVHQGPISNTTESMPLLKVEGIIVKFGGLVAVNNLNIMVQEGSIHSIIGPNGSGKTTTLNTITGLYRPDSGQIYLEGLELTGLQPYKIAQNGIARTFQHTELLEGLTVLENIMLSYVAYYRKGGYRSVFFSGAERRQMEEMAVQLCAALDLSGVMHQRVDSLSQTHRKRVEIARALALAPKILMLDEPAAGLDKEEIDELKKLILRIKDNGITIILVEHHMEVVMSVSDKITVLDFGRVVVEGFPHEIQANAKVHEVYLGKEGGALA